MILDMHVHTAASIDSTATIEGYIELVLAYRKTHPLDGFVLTEHACYTPGLTLRRHWDECGVVVIQGVEMDTNCGHLLVYGVNDRVLEHVDVTANNHDGRRIVSELWDLGAVAVPAHPFRESTFGREMERDITSIRGVRIIEALNGQNDRTQNRRAERLAEIHRLGAIGGSDAHYMNPSWFLTCATQFQDAVTTSEELAEVLRLGGYRPIRLPPMGG